LISECSYHIPRQTQGWLKSSEITANLGAAGMSMVPMAPVLVTGLPRSGTSWVGKMLERSGELVYVNEPFNPKHPPGRSPGVLNATIDHRYQYVCAENEGPWLPAFRDTAALRYHPLAELRANHAPYDVARLAKYWTAFAAGRRKGRRALLDDPYAVFTAPWLAKNLDTDVIVLLRDPASLVGSWRRLGWTFKPEEVLGQPLLMRDMLAPWEDRLRALVGRDDDLATLATMWAATYDAVDRYRQADPRIRVVRYEDLAGEPQRTFGSLYESVGLRWDDAARAMVAAATTASTSEHSGFAWSLRGGLSRTAFKPMDSKAQLAAAGCRLSAADVDRVREITAGTAAKFAPTPAAN
jgi:hypothetical protein